MAAAHCRGVPVATMAIGEAGATNAALFALRLLSVEDKAIADALANFAEKYLFYLYMSINYHL